MCANISYSFLFCYITIAILAGKVSSQSDCNSNVLGKNFVIGFPDNYGLLESNIELHILLVSFNTELTEVKLSSKFLLDGTTFGKIVQLQPGGYERVVVPSELEIIGSVKSYETIIIESDYKISVYAIHLEAYTTDGYLAIPIENLGNQYVVATYQSTLLFYNTLFAIFATVDNTIVTVQLTNEVTYEGINYFRGDTLTLELNEYEAVQIQSNATSVSDNDLTGSIVNSNKPIALISGHQCANSPGSACDVILEQNIPVNSWGNTHFYSNPPHESDYSQFRVIAYYDKTIVTLNGSDTVVLGPGEVWEDNLYGNGMITTDKPTLLIQILLRINGGTVDPSLIQVPSENQFTPFLGFTTPTHSGANTDGFINFVNIIVKSDERDTILLNDQQIIHQNDSLPSLVNESIITGSDYTLLKVELPRMEALYFITQNRSISSPMSAIVYGYESSESYGYAAGLSLPSSQRFVTIQPFYVRQLGGQIIRIDLPCQSGTIISDPVRLKCKYGLYGMLMEGEISQNGETTCSTLPTFLVGYVTLYVSLDNGVSFPFSGLIYIADEETILPQISIVNSVNAIIDFTSDEEIVLTWDRDIAELSGGPLTLELILLSDSLSASPVWEVSAVLMTNIDNSGALSINLLDVSPSHNDALTIGVFSLRQGQFYITSQIAILIFSVIPGNVCAQFGYILTQSPTGVQPCPCTRNAAGFDTNFEEDSKLIDYFHKGSAHCYRSSTPTASGSGQQCCYREDGNINLDQDGAGTADTFSPKHDLPRHFIFDVLPWFACCKHSGQSDCETYHKHRPSDDCKDYVPPMIANTQGDPHFTTIDGLEYTFNGIGEFTMASSSTYNFTFQARMERYRDTPASVYTAFAIQTHNSSKIQLQRNILNQTLILIDDHSFQLTEGIILKRIARGVTLTIATDFSQVNVQFNNGISLRVYIFPESMSFLLQLDESLRGSMEGLLGNFNGDTGDDLMLPNGSSIVSNSTLSQIHYQFGLEWMINEKSSLFTYQTPFDYNTYSNPSFLPSFISPNLSEVSPEVRYLCGDSFSCLFDAVTTGMLSFANETLIFTAIVEEIRNNSVRIISCGFPGVVENGVFNESVYFVGNVIRISCSDGFALSGTDIFRCNDDGIWSDYLPVCRESENTTIVILILVFTSLVLFTCFLTSLAIFIFLIIRNT